jgi:SHS2 domain-containing protein
MESHDTSAAIYSEAKSEYTKQLVFNFQPVLLRFFLDRYTEAKATAKTKSALSELQESLSQIPEWNLDKVKRETDTLLHSIQCDYIEDLITAVFIAHTKILSAIRLHAKPRRKINITVPKPEHFMHRSLSECSRLLWSNIYLFSDSVSSLDRQKNTNEVNRLLEDGILQAIRNLLPVKSILRDSLQDDEDDGIQVMSTPEPVESVEPEEPLTKPETTPEVKPEAKPEVDIAGISTTEDIPLINLSEVQAGPAAPAVPEAPVSPKEPATPSGTLFIDTEKSVGFTGVDSVFGDAGHAELRPMIEEGSDELKIMGEAESLDFDEFEDINVPPAVPTPLAADDYESL